MRCIWCLIIIAGILSANCVFAAVPVQEDEFLYDDHGKRDPFWRLVTTDGVIVTYSADLLVSDMILEGIIYEPGSGNNLAIINGKIVKEDDTLGLYRVTEIQAKKVLLQKGHEQFVLNLKKEGQ